MFLVVFTDVRVCIVSSVYSVASGRPRLFIVVFIVEVITNRLMISIMATGIFYESTIMTEGQTGTRMIIINKWFNLYLFPINGLSVRPLVMRLPPVHIVTVGGLSCILSISSGFFVTYAFVFRDLARRSLAFLTVVSALSCIFCGCLTLRMPDAFPPDRVSRGFLRGTRLGVRRGTVFCPFPLVGCATMLSLFGGNVFVFEIGGFFSLI